MIKKRHLLLLISTVFSIFIFKELFAKENILNIYTWSGVIPEFTIHQFEKETGIKVNFSTYDSNEVMYAKLKADKNSQYDIVEPSSYYIDRMRRQGMLLKLDKSKLSHFNNLNPTFVNQSYDPGANYCSPFLWGLTGIFVNKSGLPQGGPTKWADFWNPKYANQLLLLDDSREIFSIALRTLGYSGNDANPEHIKQAYLKLRTLLPNVKLFNSAVVSLLIDEDAYLGMAWNGDFSKAKKENKDLQFVFPSDGYIVWVDNFAIPKDAPHKENAYKFINFMLRADVAKAVSLDNNYSTTNLSAQKLLPDSIRNNKTIYPSEQTLKHGEFQTDISDEALALYEKYWERLKIGG